MPQQALAIYSASILCVCVGTWKRVTVVTQHMEHEYFNIWSNKIAVTPHCVMFFLSTLPLRPSWSLSFCGARSLVLRAKYTCHLCTSCNEALLHTFKKLTKPFSRKYFIFFQSLHHIIFLTMPTTLTHLLSLSPPPSHPPTCILFFLSPSPLLRAPAEPI